MLFEYDSRSIDLILARCQEYNCKLLVRTTGENDNIKIFCEMLIFSHMVYLNKPTTHTTYQFDICRVKQKWFKDSHEEP